MIKTGRWFLAGVLLWAAGCLAPAQGDAPDELSRLKREIEELKRRDAEKQRVIETLTKRLDALQAALGAPVAEPAALSPPGEGSPPPRGHDADEPAEGCTHAGHDHGKPGDDETASPRRMEIALDVQAAVGGSTRPDPEIPLIEGGGHDPDRRGFTFRLAELAFAGNVDPWFRVEAYLTAAIDSRTGETGVELEEAFATTACLPRGLQVKAGQFLTEFGRSNPTHPHAWTWLDQPIINTRVFGPDGMRGPGARLSWEAPLPWRSRLFLGVQNPSGQTMVSFLGDPGEAAEDPDAPRRPLAVRPGFPGLAAARHGGHASGAPGGWPVVDRPIGRLRDLVYLVRWDNAAELGPNAVLKGGGSWLRGPNATGPEAGTDIWGVDALLHWHPDHHGGGGPAFTLTGEGIRRAYTAAASLAADGHGGLVSLPETTLVDWGLNLQGVFTFRKGLAAGLRVEYASGSHDGVIPREADPLRADRLRLSPLFSWSPSHFSRFRLQYNYDRSDALDPRDSHSVWLGLEFMLGGHTAHEED
ncbi:MAG: hypothetical protein KA419_01230 [Acidobacteria bacterium]|nr:hypothetical protein [Acidobacteriota bacterium]